jgi:hypothetical protein
LAMASYGARLDVAVRIDGILAGEGADIVA